MNKILRLTFVALLALVSTAINAETKFDFANNALTMFGFTAASSSSTNDGDFNEAKSYTLDGITITISAADKNQETPNRIWGSAGSYSLRMYSGTLKVSSTKALKSISFSASKKFSITPSTGKIDKKVWTAKGDEKEVTFKISGSTQLSEMIVLLSGESVTWNNKSFADLTSATENISNVNLTLKDAKVVYVKEVKQKNETVYDYSIRQDGKALIVYGTALQLPLNATISGELKCDFNYYNGIPELKDNSSTSRDGLSITESSSTEYDATPATVADILAHNHIADLVALSNVKINADGNIVDGNDVLTNFKGIDLKGYADGKTHTIIAWFNAIYNNKAEVAAISVDGSTTGISNIQTSAAKIVRYNLAGQKVGADYKGVVISNGKKYVNK